MKQYFSRSIGPALLCLAALSACDKPGPAERAGQSIDQAASDAGRKIAESADKLEKKINEEGKKTGVAFDDSEITAKVKAAIFAEPGLSTLQISVDTVKGTVTLNGSVDSRGKSDTAAALAGRVAGVKAVNNRLHVKPAG